MQKYPKNLIITIDGHSSGGKSTFAKAIAKEMNYTYIDSGAMYRAVTLYGLRKKFITDRGIRDDLLIHDLDKMEINLVYNPDNDKQETFLNGENVEDEIRDIAVSLWVSPVSKIQEVREKLVSLQRKIAEGEGVVMDGRDIGTVVFPDADIKIFLTARVDVRAQRRFLELKEKGITASLEEIKGNIEDRDYQDSMREISPLIKPDDAYELDNSDMTVEDQMEWFGYILREKYDTL